MHYCPFCEAEPADHAVFCSRCGGVLSTTVTIDEAGDKRCNLVAADDMEQQDTLVVRSLVAADDMEQQDTLVVRSLVAADDREQQDTLVVHSLVAADDREQQDTLVVHSLVAAGAKRRSPSSDDVQPLAFS